MKWLNKGVYVCVTEGKIPVDWKRAIVLPIHAGKGDQNKCKNYRGISLLRVPGKVYGRMLIEKARCTTEHLIED